MQKLTFISRPSIAALLILFVLSSLMLTGDDAAPKHGVLREMWFEIQGTEVKDLTGHASFQKKAGDTKIVANIDDQELGDRFGSRYSGYLEVPETGDYVFYIASDDASELWLGKDATQNDMSCIAYVKGYTFRHNWGNQVNQKSAPVRLEKGKKYYLYVLHKEGQSADHVSIAWTGPNIKEPAVIPSEAFTPPAAEK